MVAQNSTLNQPEKKKWEEFTLAEKKESYLKYVIKEISQSIKGKYAPFTEESQILQKAYNASNGLPYTNLNSLILDIKQKEHNYKENAWITLKDARFLGAENQEINEIFKNKDIPKAQISYIKTFEINFIDKLDKFGNKIPLSDINGNPKLDKNGNHLYQKELEPQRDKAGNIKVNPKTNEPYMKYKTQKTIIEPTLETQILYNISEFKTLDKKRIKSLNQDQEYKNFIRHKQDFDSTKSNLIFQDIEANLYPQTASQILTYLKAQNNNTSYTPPIKLNDLQQRQVEQKIEGILEEKGLSKLIKASDSPKIKSTKNKKQESEKTKKSSNPKRR
ncbi:ArdC-like ssDNA-binding domain-containing protein [Helicobacter sp. 13S00477-4]|uniref:ArdC-like ssDNA-binding domain-containing protein n=1 Tax=Helicobacter sp. 13S00477-4 TaxID=1905759 RepID=UPI000BA63AC5|nr:ArdC-like ssDNA-binding domain-containing protein [Helicobacter sp. 13S00477-4]PAF50479.1 hypothetical protein BKH44_08185 [Helicobacter sp. 13S00477-4]